MLRGRATADFSFRVRRVRGDGWLAVGDALMSFDPLASSGLSGAFNDAVAAADAVLEMLGGSDPRPAYARRASAASRRYLAGHAAHYGLERRWRSRDFWKRRSPEPILAATA